MIYLVFILNVFNNYSVYLSLIEKINRKMVDIKKVRMAKGLILIMVIKVKELNMVVQIRLDSLGFSFVIKNI